ncbi:MAG TPA: 6-carboxytetrahydropterin synthase [Kineosporiaceae bacterium]
MTYLIGKTFSFSASHSLPDLPVGHQCARLHGHNYRVEVVLRAEDLSPPGFVTDFADLSPFKTYLQATLDHRHLNDVLPAAPTSENLAAHLAAWFIENLQPALRPRLATVRVQETDSTWAEYHPAVQR